MSLSRVSFLAFLVLTAVSAAVVAQPAASWQHLLRGDHVGSWGEPFTMRALADGSTMVVYREGWPISAVRYAPNGLILTAVDFLVPSVRGVAIDPFGSLYVIADPIGARGRAVFWTMKYDGITGRKLWPAAVRFDGATTFGSAPTAITVAPNGDALVTGYTSEGSTARIVTLRYDRANGAIRWANVTASGRRAAPYTIAVDRSGDVLVAGVDVPAGSSGGQPGWTVIKYEGLSGHQSWKTDPVGVPFIPMVCPGSCFTPVVAKLALDSRGAVFVSVSSFGASYQEWLTLKYDGASGARLWGPIAFNGSAAGYEAPQGIAVDADSNVIVTGSSGAIEVPGSTRAVVKYAGLTGALIWGPVFLGTDLSRGAGFLLDGPGNPIAIGSASSGDRTSWSAAQYSGRTGALLWRRTFFSLPIAASPYQGEPRLATLHGDGRAVIAGNALPVSSHVTPTLAFEASTGSTLWGPVAFVGASRAESAPTAILTDSQGNAIVVATSGGRGEGGAVLKRDRESGEAMWGPVPFSHVPSGWPTAAAIAPDDDVFVTGRFSRGAEGWRTGTSKYDGGTGSVSWGPIFLDLDRYGGPIDVVVDSGGNPIVLVNSYSESGGNYRLSLVKYDGGSGTVLWGPVVFDPFPYVVAANVPPRLSIDPNGNVFVVAAVTRVAGYGATATAKYDGANGSVLWGPLIWQLNAFDGGYPIDLAVDGAGDAFVVAVGNSNSTDWAIVKYSGRSGTPVWGPRRYPSTFERPVDVALDGANDVLVIGRETYSFAFRVLKVIGVDGSLSWMNRTPVGSAAGLAVIAADSRGDPIALAGTQGPNDGDWVTAKYRGTTGEIQWGPVSFDAGGGESPVALLVSGTDFFVAASKDRKTLIIRYTESLAIDTPDHEVNPALCGDDYRLALSARNGATPYAWSIARGSLPSGLALVSSGEITGQPAEEGTFPVTVRVTDAAGRRAERDLTVDVVEGGGRPSIVVEKASSSCPRGQRGYRLTLPGGFTVQSWLPGGETTEAIDVCPENSTLYGVLATDERGCTRRSSIELGPVPTRPLPRLPLIRSTAAPENR